MRDRFIAGWPTGTCFACRAGGCRCKLPGSGVWYVDPATDTGALRTIIGRAVEASKRRDRRFWNCQVTDVTADAIQVRGLMTAKDAGTAFDLRCEVREAVLAAVRAQMPQALPRRRVSLGHGAI